ncbi:hypothetical protein [Methylosinus sp. PW1]|uniref:hypothetical protein n=1 Tax=Methylosinus sp. PW1 TaxID=107636 RepID=UPI00056361FC|nr:hypothetical protein [Methylosinus sp. PW1]
MNIPEAFSDLAEWLMFEVEEDIPEGQDYVAYAIGHLDESQKMGAERFIDGLLRQELSDRELIDIWFRAGARMGFAKDADYRVVLIEVLHRLRGD